ncbi:ribonuclease P protein component [Thermodesulfobacteriota bacterium]
MKRYGLSRDDRIRRSSDFTRITREGKRIPSRHFIIFFLNNDLDRNRLGITASRKVGGAVVRNKVKRSIREVFRTNRNLLPPGGDVVVIARHNASEADYAQVRDELVTLFSRISDQVSEG